MKNRYWKLLKAGLILTSLALAPYAAAGDDEAKENKESKKPTIIEKMVVKENVNEDNNLFVVKTLQPYSESTITKEGINTLAGPAQNSLTKTLDLLPSVSVESLDPYGLSKQGRFIRIRGQGAMSISYELDGIPLDAAGGSTSQENSFDMENISGVTLYRGAAPVDQGMSWGNIGGSVNMSILDPQDNPAVIFTEGLGTDSFNRTFIRVDTGEIIPHLKSFISFSHTEADKWKGAGDTERKHVATGITFSPSAKLDASLYFDYNKRNSHNYMSLTYAQIQDLKTNYTYDYNTALTGIQAQDVNYYDLNKLNDDYLRIHSKININFSDKQSITIKPYFARSKYLSYESMRFNGVPSVYEWKQDRTQYGSIIDYTTTVLGTDLSLGYWIEFFKWPGYTAKMYNLTSSGDLTFSGWYQALLKYDGYFRYDTPYLALNKSIGRFNAHAGLKYFRFTMPETIAYTSTGVPDVSTDDVFGYAAIDEEASIGEKTTDAWLPSAGISYEVNDQITSYFNYGRSYLLAFLGGGGFINSYWANRALYNSLGINADMLADEAKLPTADNFDLGTRFNIGSWYITPTLFYSRQQNKNVTYLNPDTGVQSKQTVGKAKTYGAELELAGAVTDSLTLFTSGSYNRSEFTENINTRGDTTDIKGNMFPDTPKYMGKLGVNYRPNFLPDLQIAPVMRYIGSRYADATNLYKVSGYFTADLNINYTIKNIPTLFKEVILGVSVGNILDKEYIAAIRAADEARQTAASYYTGAPRSFAGSVSVKF